MALKQLFGGIYDGADVLVTGHTGFKGSWLCLWLQQMGARVTGIALPPPTEPAHWPLLALDGVRDLRVDIRDAAVLREAVADARPQLVFHFAAQPLVRSSYDAPSETFATNVMGLVNLFEALRDVPTLQAVVNATTDKVYLDHAAERGYREDDPLGGHDPYSTSKACAELVSDCYRRSFFTGAGRLVPRLATARAGNVIGGGDWAIDRLVPDLVRAALAQEPLRLRNPAAIRPWQHVLEPLSGYLRLGQALLAGPEAEGAWNFGPDDDSALSVQTMVDEMRSHWPAVADAPSPGPHPHEAATLRLDRGKAARGLGWHPVWSAQSAVAFTVEWYRAFHEHGRVRSLEDLARYVSDARAAGLDWAA
jgi:CDP-glucose 4,6-dehydratase